MDQEQMCCGSVFDRIPPLSQKYPWLVAENPEAGDQILYTINDPLSQYHCRIPELLGRRIRGCFHGWVILSKHPDNVMWSLWNPSTSKIVRLPPLILKSGDYKSIDECCLSFPPNNPSSVLLLTTGNATIVFFRLDCKRKRFKWTEMTYAKQLRSIIGCDGLLCSLTCCNDKVYALDTVVGIIIQIDLVFKEKELVISLLPFKKLVYPCFYDSTSRICFIKGCCGELFNIVVRFEVSKKAPVAVYLFKLDMTSMTWEEMEDLKDAVFFVDLAHSRLVFYSPAISFGGYIHILSEMGKLLYSYNVKDRTIFLSSMPSLVLPTSHVSFWECRLQDDRGEIHQCRAGSKQEKDKEDKMEIRPFKDDKVDNNHIKNIESHLLNIPFHILEIIMERCVGVEYLNFRTTSKRCHLAAPVIHWSNGAALKRLRTYSLISPWLMVFDKHRCMLTFTDPASGDNYFMKTPQELIGYVKILCSRYGWLLMFKLWEPLVFYNPFTCNIIKLPPVPFLKNFCFSAPPTSPDCMVVGFTPFLQWHVYIHFVAREPTWRKFRLYFGGADPYAFCYPTLNGQDLYALHNEGELDVFKGIDKGVFSWEHVLAKPPRGCCGSSTQYFLMNCDRHLLLVITGEIAESIKVFKLNESRDEWQKIDNIGRKMIYICGATCLCIEAKTPEMENKIYFPHLHSDNGKIVFYSLETNKFHTFNGKTVEKNFGDFLGTKQHLNSHVWIEPSWS